MAEDSREPTLSLARTIVTIQSYPTFYVVVNINVVVQYLYPYLLQPTNYFA